MSKLPYREIRKSSLSPTTQAILSLIEGLLPAVVAVAAGLWAVHTYLAQEKAKIEQSIKEVNKAQLERRLKAQEPFLRKQLDLFFTTAGVTGQLINLTPGTPDWDAAEKRFWSLRWSEVEMAGDAGIRQAMRRVQYALVQRKADSSEWAKHKLRWMVECLADELRLSLEDTWGIRPPSTRPTAAGEERAKLPEGCQQAHDGEPPLPKVKPSLTPAVPTGLPWSQPTPILPR